MPLTEWRIAVKLADRPWAPKSIVQLPETQTEGASGGYRISALKQLIADKILESTLDPDLIDLIYCGRKLKDEQTLEFYGIKPGSTVHVLKKCWPEPDQKPEPLDRAAAAREFRVLHTALMTPSYRDAVFKILENKETLDHIIVATPGLCSDPVALGVLQDKDLFTVFTDPNMLDTLINSHPALVNAIVLVLQSVAGSTTLLPPASGSSRNVPSSSYSEMPGGFMFDDVSDDEDDMQQGTSSGTSPVLGSGVSSSIQSSTPITNDIFSQALQQALQASSMPGLQSQWQQQLQQLRDMGIQDDDLSLRALQATGGDIQAALELIFAGGAP
ncbi:ubiquitin-like protein 7 isoform X2 [Protopterus annectens]|uniref:ubiquitin-like protein 7 isoform X2 n=1 Tax=Protopterus annectens TaxID=7888 RepID=UPI001CFB21EA|nr:ubiquitin-like protein 7 isoform X2 [Protopterus annectens]